MNTANTVETMAVAETIRAQLGAGTLAMLGAKDLVGAAKSLRFKIRGSKAVNLIQITLADDDTYNVAFMKQTGLSFRVVSSASGVYVDSLHTLIERTTGLSTRL